MSQPSPQYVRGEVSLDESMSMNSNGVVVPSNTVFTWRRFVTSLRQGRIPITLLLVAFISVLTVGIALISWELTYSAATTAADSLSVSLQRQILTTIISNVETILEATEQSTMLQVANWADGTFQLSDREAVLKVLHNTVEANYNFYSTQTFTTVSNGYMWEAITDDSGSQPNFLDWRQGATYDGNLTTWNGSVLVDSYASPDNADGYWVTAVVGPNTPESTWSSVQVWQGKGWKTHCRRIYDQSSAVLGAQNADLTLDFLQRLLADSASAMPIDAYLYALEMSPQGQDVMIASSIPTLDFYGYDDMQNAVRTLSFAEMAQKDQIVAILFKEFAGYASLASYMAAMGTETRLLQLPGGAQFMLQMGEVKRDDNTHWVIVMLLDRDAIMMPLHDSNRKTIGIVVAVVVAACVLSVLFSYFLAKALHKITKDLSMLADFKFQEVLQEDLDRKTGLRRPKYSRISELWRIQRAFHKMVVTFAQALSRNRQFSDAMNADRVGGISRRPTIGGQPNSSSRNVTNPASRTNESPPVGGASGTLSRVNEAALVAEPSASTRRVDIVRSATVLSLEEVVGENQV
ncbi:hypothetical protein HDU87_001659 [Geranomyces variabilis]|uniref:Cache domain-containing protein n=1 Tax=Geranomyces variabilis TaxID=109894 RepID=A0AAD5TMM4_9FUNG|nr:hypothetical protein HDU87_001659 [Geranomyces variabilis]